MDIVPLIHVLYVAATRFNFLSEKNELRCPIHVSDSNVSVHSSMLPTRRILVPGYGMRHISPRGFRLIDSFGKFHNDYLLLGSCDLFTIGANDE